MKQSAKKFVYQWKQRDIPMFNGYFIKIERWKKLDLLV